MIGLPIENCEFDFQVSLPECADRGCFYLEFPLPTLSWTSRLVARNRSQGRPLMSMMYSPTLLPRAALHGLRDACWYSIGIP